MVIDKMLAHKEQFIPSAGYHLLGIDGMEPFGEELYFISAHATLEEARKAGGELDKDSMDRYFILDSDGVGYDID